MGWIEVDMGLGFVGKWVWVLIGSVGSSIRSVKGFRGFGWVWP